MSLKNKLKTTKTPFLKGCAFLSLVHFKYFILMAQDDFINAPCMWRYLLFTHCTHSLLLGRSISIIWRKNTSSALKTFRFLSQRCESYRTSYWYLSPLNSLVGGNSLTWPCLWRVTKEACRRACKTRIIAIRTARKHCMSLAHLPFSWHNV